MDGSADWQDGLGHCGTANAAGGPGAPAGAPVA